MSESSDEGAFEELFNLYYTWLHSVAISIIRKREDAEEIVEDVFLKLWEIREGFGKIENLETYLYTATKNKSYDYYKKSSKVHLVEFETDWKEDEYIISAEDAYLYEELKSKYQDAVNNLPSKCKEAFLMIKEEGHSYMKAGEILGVSHRTVENHLRTAIQKIREELKIYLSSPSGDQGNKLYMLFFLF
ncbi:MAG: RNA polymerase sigma-70 factor (family 1) [Cyclobacteriaceae bacterium]|jgi:RNA polymerase sigma-70 factor (ECF subfamily)